MSAFQAVRYLASAESVVVLAGLAGCGKTELLADLAADGEQVLDLEALASHRGSAFGGIGLPAQPSHEAFVRAARAARAAADPKRVLWLEDEGPFIGRVGLPPELADEIALAPVVEVRASFEDRVERIVATYTVGADAAELEAAIERSTSRLGAQRAERAISYVRRGELRAAVRLVLPAYDDAYAHRMARLERRVLGTVTTAGTDRARDPADVVTPRA